MKNNFLQEAYGSLREARSKHYCLGLPRKWKVITSTLLLLFTFAIGNVWGADPTISSYDWEKDVVAKDDVAKTYTTEGVIVSCTYDLTNNSSVTKSSKRMQFFKMADNASTIDEKCFGIKSTSAVIDSVAIFWVPNSTDESGPGFIAWKSGVTPSTAVDTCGQFPAVTSSLSYSNAKWDVVDLSGKNIVDIRFSRSWRASTTKGGASTGYVGINKTIDILGYKVWLHPATPTCDATAPGNISKGALSAGILTLQVADDPKTGDEFYWQTSATGTTKNKTGENINFGKTYQVSAAGTYYIRSYNVAGDCWSDAKSITISATDLVENYTVVYKDGTTELGSEPVEVGHHPTAAGITTTKEFYTFAAWQESGVDKALNDVSAAKDETVTLTARYTAQYTSGTYEFTGHLTMGTAPNQMTIENSSDGQNYDAGRIDNIYVSAQKIGYQNDGGNYDGWKLKTTDGTLRFMVENTCGVRVTLGEAKALRISYTEGGVAKSADIANSTVSSVYKADANSLVTLTNFTASNKTVTLKKIEILPLYNATYVDETGDGEDGGNPENVTEVTLPTPSETTVGSYSFTGWVANQTVKETKVGGVEKTAGAVLTAGETYQLYATTTFTAQWQLISDFDVKFFQGYGTNEQIGDTQPISTGGHAVAPDDPTRTGFAFLGWSYDATEAHIVDVAAYGITAATNFTAMWKAVWTVTFNGAGNVEVQDGEAVASPDSPTQTGKIFQGWYNGESKYDFSAAVTGNLALTSKWADADANHYVYAYNDDFHYDGVVYKTPEGKVDAGNGNQTLNLTTPYTLFSGTEGITSIVMTDGIYDSKAGAIQAVTSHLKVNNNATSKLTITIKAGYTATLKIKAAGYSASRTMNVSDATPASLATPTDAKIVTSNAMTLGTLEQQTFTLTSGSHDLTVTGGTLYISELDVEAEALPAFTVTYKAGEGTGDDVEDTDATEVADVPGTFTAPTGKIFNGWKDGDNNDVEVGTIVTGDMTLTAQWINHYAVTFNMQDHGTQVDPQNIVSGGKVTKPADPVVIGWDFGGWFTNAACTAGNEFDFNTAITEAKELFAKWTEFDGCVLLVPATSGEALTVGATVDLQTGSTGGSIKVANLGAEGSIAYNANGLSFSNGGKDSVLVTLNNDLKNGSIIKVRLMANGGTKDSGRGLNLYNAARVKKALLGWQANEEVTSGDIREFTYTVVESDGFAGTNVFTLQRQNSVFLQSIKVEECGDAVVYHNLTSEVSIAGKGIVTLGASSVREGYTTTATYSDIDPLYEFVSWSISGEGATLSSTTANPVTITMGTADAVVTLNLQVKPVYYTVTYYDGASEMGTEQVAENGHPTATGIATKKLGYNFLGWSETDGGAVINLNEITITDVKDLFAKYEAVVCPTSGTVYKFEVKEGLASENLPTSTNKDMSSYVDETGNGYLTYTATADNKAVINDNGTIQMKDVTAAYLKVELACALAAGDQIRSHITNNPMRVQVGTTYDSSKDLILEKNAYDIVEITSDMVGLQVLYITRSSNGNANIADFEIYRRPALTGVTLEDMTMRIGQERTPVMTLIPEDAMVTSQAWTIESSTPAGIATINAGTGAITATAEGTITVKVVLNGNPAMTDECTVTIVENIPQQDVTGSIVWDWTMTGATSNNQLNNTSDPKKNENFVLANVVPSNANFASNKLAVEGEYMTRDYNKTTPYFQGQLVSFKFAAAKEGVIRVTYAHTTNNVPDEKPAREIYVNGVATGEIMSSQTFVASRLIPINAAEVEITARDINSTAADAKQYFRVAKIEFFEYDTERNDSWIAPGELGTICYPNGHVFTGAEIYEMAGVDSNGKFVFDEVTVTEPGKPYLFVATSYEPIKFYKTTAAAEASPIANNGMIGTFVSIDLDYTDARAAKWYYFSGMKFYAVSKRTSDLNVPANRAYVDLNESHPAGAPKQGVRRLTFNVDGMNAATGMDELNASETPVKMLIDGQLFILRGEKMYNANGQLVK